MVYFKGVKNIFAEMCQVAKESRESHCCYRHHRRFGIMLRFVEAQ